MKVEEINSIKIKLASPEEILSWSRGEVLKSETINYRTQKAEKDGLFCERIFGPEKDYQCYCGKYKGIRYKGMVCDRCGVELIKASARRERMGHIVLACPISHIWFLRGVPSVMGGLLNLSSQQLEKIVYFASYIITKVEKGAKKGVWEEIEREYREKIKNQDPKIKSEFKKAKERARKDMETIKPLKVLSELEYMELSSKYGEIFEAGTGAEVLRKIFINFNFKKLIDESEENKKKITEVERKKFLRRNTLLKDMYKAKVRPEWMFLTVLPVLPSALRPMVQLDGGRYASSDLNDLYRRVINRNNRLKYLLEINAPEVILRNEKRMLQEAVDALIDNGMRSGHTTIASTGQSRLLKSLADALKGKQGRFRQNLLGKRVDYSGRSVIVGDPDLNFSQCGLPKKMALELFKPFVSAYLLEKELAYNVRQASSLIERGVEEVWEALEAVIKDKLVLLNRAPTLHRLGVQAFSPKLVEGEAIRIHSLVCEAFNADFDGDQMAVFVPLSEKAQKESRERMLSGSNLLKPATGLSVVSPRQDMVLGCYWLTRIKDGAKGEGKIFSSKKEALLACQSKVIDLRAKIKVRIKDELLETSLGRMIFNEALPSDFPFQNELIPLKKLKDFTRQIIEDYDSQTATEVLDKIKKIGFEYATVSGLSWGMDDLKVPPEKPKLMKKAEAEIKKIEDYFDKGLLTDEERKSQVIEVWHKVKAEIQRLVPMSLKKDGIVFTAIDAGARGSWSQPVQMAGMKGLVINPAGQIMEFPAKSSFKEGFGVLEYFISTHGARKGTADTALRTSSAGYLTRRLIDVAHDIFVSEVDCQEKEGITVTRGDSDEVGQDFIFKIVGRISLENIPTSGQSKEKLIVKKNELINWEKARVIVDSPIKRMRVRSPLSCKSDRGVCQKCYGWDLGHNRLAEIGEAVGIVAAQAIGEPGTQLTLRTFHSGGVASVEDITHGLPRVEEVFETRVPKGEAVVALNDGRVMRVEKEIVKIKNSESEIQDSKSEIKKRKTAKKKGEMMEYGIPHKRTVLVKEGEEIKAGQQLCEGSIDLKKLFKAAGSQVVAAYIIKEVQKIYASQGVAIHDKHIETIVRQMFSRIKIKSKGGSQFSEGQIVEKGSVIRENKKLKEQGKELIVFQNLILGISKVALTTDSFLSAASFEETSRILIKAAITGQEDCLMGLKENVIIGKLIPIGTGYKKT